MLDSVSSPITKRVYKYGAQRVPGLVSEGAAATFAHLQQRDGRLCIRGLKAEASSASQFVGLFHIVVQTQQFPSLQC